MVGTKQLHIARFAGLGLVAPLLLAISLPVLAQGVSQRRDSSGGLSGTEPFRSDFARPGARGENAARPYRDPAAINEFQRRSCTPEMLRRDPNRRGECR